MTVSDTACDFLVVGSGIAAASLGYWLAPHGKVVLLERESQPGYHSTGRSAAMFVEGYGPEQVRALTRASRAFFECPPQGFCDHPILRPRGTLTVASLGQQAMLDAHWAVVQPLARGAQLLDADATCAMVPVMRPDRVLGAVLEPDACDIDVHTLHQGYLRGISRHCGVVVCDAEVMQLVRESEMWRVRSNKGVFTAPIVVNAAGAWCDEVAKLAGIVPLGLTPKRRSAFVFAPPQGLACAHWPLCLGVDESWYFKPDAGQLLGSPANADPVAAQDIQPEEMDIATGIDRIQAMTTLSIPRPGRVWAGLRTFSSDGELVGGFDASAPGFFWLAGQGGYGIQTSAAMGLTCACLVRGLPVPLEVTQFGVSAQRLDPQRFTSNLPK